MTLTDIQREIIDTKGNLIVRASAGTGKTYTMVRKIEFELAENKTHKTIAAITFTIKAAREIRDRLAVDIGQHFIGTNNSFVIEEIIKPFIKDVYGKNYDIDIGTDYSVRVDNFEEGIHKIITDKIMPSYRDNTKNFIFELGYRIISSSPACQLYLKARYLKLYIDEYQDCDRDMHKLFMYISDRLLIDTFIIGDEKQSIYMWRGAYPEAFTSVWSKNNYKNLFMRDNFRSVIQIQNYSNLLIEDTRELYQEVDNLVNIIWIKSSGTWTDSLLNYLDTEKEFAILRFSNSNAKQASKDIQLLGKDCKFIPHLYLSDITTNASWLYMSIAKYCILDFFSVYDLIAEIPVEADETQQNIHQLKRFLEEINNEVLVEDVYSFKKKVDLLANYLNLTTRDEHLLLLYETILDKESHIAFDSVIYNHIAITFHSSKGLEFEQVVIFAEDYRLNDITSIYNHYVATTRAEKKLIIIKSSNYNANLFERNLKRILSESQLGLESVVSFAD